MHEKIESHGSTAVLDERGLTANGACITVDTVRHESGSAAQRRDVVAAEEPLEIRLGYATPQGRASRSVSITMRTPGHDLPLAAGFLFTESIVKSADEIASMTPCGPRAPDTGNHNVVRVELQPNVSVDLGRLERHFYTSSSCGVCGKTSLDAVRANGVERITGNEPRFSKRVITALPARLRSVQETFEKTGGLHAAAAFDVRGNLMVTMEDVGRHNAVDKVIGCLLMDGQLPAGELGLVVSGRASFELLQKAAVAGMPLLAAVSAPSSLAVSLAEELGVTLIGFLRGETFNVYAGGDRLCP